MEKYREALDWWNDMALEMKFYKTMEFNSAIAGDNTRHPDTLTGREINAIHNAYILNL